MRYAASYTDSSKKRLDFWGNTDKFYDVKLQKILLKEAC